MSTEITTQLSDEELNRIAFALGIVASHIEVVEGPLASNLVSHLGMDSEEFRILTRRLITTYISATPHQKESDLDAAIESVSPAVTAADEIVSAIDEST